eukprot:629158-Prymnesium_polylepis.1
MGPLCDIGDFIKLPYDKSGSRNYRIITNVLKHYLNSEPLAYHGGGRNPKLTHTEALVVADCSERGTGREQAAYIIPRSVSGAEVERATCDGTVCMGPVRGSLWGVGEVGKVFLRVLGQTLGAFWLCGREETEFTTG